MKIETNVYRAFTVKKIGPTKYTKACIEIYDHFFNESKNTVYEYNEGDYRYQAVNHLKNIGFNVIGITELKDIGAVILCDWSMNTGK
jgi:hypothetical protein